MGFVKSTDGTLSQEDKISHMGFLHFLVPGGNMDRNPDEVDQLQEASGWISERLDSAVPMPKPVEFLSDVLICLEAGWEVSFQWPSLSPASPPRIFFRVDLQHTYQQTSLRQQDLAVIKMTSQGFPEHVHHCGGQWPSLLTSTWPRAMSAVLLLPVSTAPFPAWGFGLLLHPLQWLGLRVINIETSSACPLISLSSPMVLVGWGKLWCCSVDSFRNFVRQIQWF